MNAELRFDLHVLGQIEVLNGELLWSFTRFLSLSTEEEEKHVKIDHVNYVDILNCPFF